MKFIKNFSFKKNFKFLFIKVKKLNNIVDDAYKKQLLGYKDIIKKKTAKPIKTYLYSIIQEEFKEIKDSD